MRGGKLLVLDHPPSLQFMCWGFLWGFSERGSLLNERPPEVELFLEETLVEEKPTYSGVLLLGGEVWQ